MLRTKSWPEWALILAALTLWGLGNSRAAESPDLQELLARMKALEAKVAEQAQTIAALKTEDKYKVATGEKVDQALAKSAPGFFHDPDLHARPVKVGGYLDVSYMYSLNRPWDAANHLRGFDNQDANTFDVHLAQLYFDGAAQEKGQAGFRLDLAFGNDACKTGGITDNMFALLQAYVDYIVPVGNGVRVKLGKFVTPHGFEVVQAQDNWNASRSFNYTLGMPITHTGLAVEYPVFTDKWTVRGYLVNGWDQDLDNNAAKTAMLQSAWTPVKWFSWTITGAAGCEKNRSILAGDTSDLRYIVNTALTFNPWKNWNFALEGTWAKEQGFQLTHLDRGAAEWYGAAAYAKWDFARHWYLASRTEYFNDRGGSRTAGLATFPARFGNFSEGQKLWSQTVTASWTLARPMELRFEYRHDESSESPFSGHEIKPADLLGVTHSSRATQDTLMVQWLYKF